MMNSLEFEKFKLYADSTFKSMKKDELSVMLAMEEKNWEQNQTRFITL